MKSFNKFVSEAKDTHCSDKCCGADVKAEDCTCPADCPHCNCNTPLQAGYGESFDPKHPKVVAARKAHKAGNWDGNVDKNGNAIVHIKGKPHTVTNEEVELDEAAPKISKGKAKGSITATGIRGKGMKKFDVKAEVVNGKFEFMITDETGKFQRVNIKKAAAMLGEQAVAELTELTAAEKKLVNQMYDKKGNLTPMGKKVMNHGKKPGDKGYVEAYSEPQGQAKRMSSPLQKIRMDKEKADRDRDGKLPRKSLKKEEVNKLDEDTINQMTAQYINENNITMAELEAMSPEQLDEIIGKAIGGAFKAAAKTVVGAGSLAKKAANRVSASGRADAAEKKADKQEKKNKDRARIKAAQDRLRAAKAAARNK